MNARFLAGAALALVMALPVKADDKPLKTKLDQRVAVEFEAGPLKDALAQIGERYNIAFTIDTEAFKSECGIPDIEAQPVRLSRVTDIRLARALQLLLGQVRGTFVIRDGGVKIGPISALFDEIKLQKTMEFDEAERDLMRKLEDLKDARRLALLQLRQDLNFSDLQPASAPTVSVSTESVPWEEALKRLQQIENRLTAIEKRVPSVATPAQDKKRQ
jgi:hypothetical protein